MRRLVLCSCPAIVVDHSRPPIAAPVVNRSMQKVAVEDEEIAGLHKHRHSVAVAYVSHDSVALVSARAIVSLVYLDRQLVRSGKHRQTSVLERRFSDREPQSHLRLLIELEIVAVLMPRLPPRTGVFEDKLRLEYVYIWAKQLSYDASCEVALREVSGATYEVRVEQLCHEIFRPLGLLWNLTLWLNKQLAARDIGPLSRMC